MGFPTACAMAAKASRRRNWVYAAALYGLSRRLHANALVDLEPRMYPHRHRSPFPNDHVRFAYSVVTSYAIVEQLGLEVRASDKNPSMIGNEWNPAVLHDLEERLEKVGIASDRTIMWMVRGGKTRIETKRPARTQGMQIWAHGRVRDCEVRVVDAISSLSWLRSKVSAHRVDELVELISAYDVANAQNLARLLILNSIGFAESS